MQIVFAGAAGAYGYGLPRHDSATLHKAFEGVRFENGLTLELDLGPDGLDQAESVAAHIAAASARRPGDVDIAFGLDPIGVAAALRRGRLPWAEEAKLLAAAGAKLKGAGFFGAVRRRRRPPGPCGGRHAGAGTRLRARLGRRLLARARGRRAFRPRARARGDFLPPCGRRRRVRHAREIPRLAPAVGERRGGGGARAGAGARPRRKRVAHDERARPLRERDAQRRSPPFRPASAARTASRCCRSAERSACPTPSRAGSRATRSSSN